MYKGVLTNCYCLVMLEQFAKFVNRENCIYFYHKYELTKYYE